MPEVMRSSNLESVPQIDVISVSIVELNDSEESRKFGYNSKKTHGLSPPVPESSFCGDDQLIIGPFVQDIVEEYHAGIHIKSSLIV